MDKLIKDLWGHIGPSQRELARPTTGTVARMGFRTGMTENQFTYRNDPGPSKRRKCREWGLTYVTRPGETPDPEDPETTTPTTDTPPEV